MTQGPTAVFLMGYLPCHVCELGDLECKQQCCSQPWSAERCSWKNTPHSTKPFQPPQQAKGQAVNVRGQHSKQLPSYYSPSGSKYISNWSAMTQQVLRHTTRARLMKGATLAPGVQWGWESCGGQPPVSTLLPYYHQAGESGRVTDLQGFHKEAEMQGFWCFPPLFNVKSLFLNVGN